MTQKEKLRGDLANIMAGMIEYRGRIDKVAPRLTKLQRLIESPLSADDVLQISSVLEIEPSLVAKIKRGLFNYPTRANNDVLHRYAQIKYDGSGPNNPLGMGVAILSSLNQLIKDYVAELFVELNATAGSEQTNLKAMYLRRDISRFEVLLGEETYALREGIIDWTAISIDRDYILEDYNLEFLDKYTPVRWIEKSWIGTIDTEIRQHLNAVDARLRFIERLESFGIFTVSA